MTSITINHSIPTSTSASEVGTGMGTGMGTGTGTGTMAASSQMATGTPSDSYNVDQVASKSSSGFWWFFIIILIIITVIVVIVIIFAAAGNNGKSNGAKCKSQDDCQNKCNGDGVCTSSNLQPVDGTCRSNSQCLYGAYCDLTSGMTTGTCQNVSST